MPEQVTSPSTAPQSSDAAADLLLRLKEIEANAKQIVTSSAASVSSPTLLDKLVRNGRQYQEGGSSGSSSLGDTTRTFSTSSASGSAFGSRGSSTFDHLSAYLGGASAPSGGRQRDRSYGEIDSTRKATAGGISTSDPLADFHASVLAAQASPGGRQNTLQAGDPYPDLPTKLVLPSTMRTPDGHLDSSFSKPRAGEEYNDAPPSKGGDFTSWMSTFRGYSQNILASNKMEILSTYAPAPRRVRNQEDDADGGEEKTGQNQEEASAETDDATSAKEKEVKVLKSILKKPPAADVDAVSANNVLTSVLGPGSPEVERKKTSLSSGERNYTGVKGVADDEADDPVHVIPASTRNLPDPERFDLIGNMLQQLDVVHREDAPQWIERTKKGDSPSTTSDLELIQGLGRGGTVGGQPFLYAGDEGGDGDEGGAQSGLSQRTLEISQPANIQGGLLSSTEVLESEGVNVHLRTELGKLVTRSRGFDIVERRRKLMAHLEYLDKMTQYCVNTLLQTNQGEYQGNVANLRKGVSFSITFEKLPKEQRDELQEQVPEIAETAEALKVYWKGGNELCNLLQWKWRMTKELTKAEAALENKRLALNARGGASASGSAWQELLPYRAKVTALSDKVREFGSVIQVLDFNREKEPDVSCLGDRDQEKTLLQIRLMQERIQLLHMVDNAGGRLRELDLQIIRVRHTRERIEQDAKELGDEDARYSQSAFSRALLAASKSKEAGKDLMAMQREEKLFGNLTLQQKIEVWRNDPRTREFGRRVQNLETARKTTIEEIDELTHDYTLVQAQWDEVSKERVEAERTSSQSLHETLGLPPEEFDRFDDLTDERNIRRYLDSTASLDKDADIKDGVRMGRTTILPGKITRLDSLQKDLLAKKENLSKIILAKHKELQTISDKKTAAIELAISAQKMENKVSGQTATIDVGLKSLLPRNALERNGVDKFVTSRIGDEGRQMSAAKREEAAELDPVGAYFRNAQQRDSFRKSRIRSDVVRDIGGMDTDQTAYYLDVGRRGKHALPTKGLYNETIYFNALDAAGKSENDLGQFSDWIWREKKTIDNVLHGDKTRLEMFFYPEGEEQEDKEQEDDQGTGTETETEVLDHGGEGVLNARRGASSADKDVAAAAKGNHETSSTKSRKLSTRVRSEEAPERERLLPREDEDENKFEDPIDKIKKSELALVSRRPKKERLLPPPSDHEEDEEVVEEAVSPVAGGALDKLIADLRDRADRVGDGKDSQVEDSDIFPPPRPTTTSSSGTMKQNRIQQIEADLLGEGSVEYPFMPMDGGSSSQASSKTSTSSKNTSDLSNSSSSSSTSVDVAADDSSSRTSLVPELEDKKSVFKRSAPAIIDDILAKKKRSSTPVSLAQAHVDVEYDKTPLNDQETKTTDVEQDKRMSTLSDGKNNFEGRHAAGNNEEHAVRLERELASLRADLDRTVKKQEEDSSNRDKKHSNKKNKKERSPKKKSSTTSTSSASEEVVRNLPNTTSTTSSFASGASSPSKKKDFLYYREKFSDVPLANQIELNREQGRRFWGDKIRDLESQIEEKNRLLLRAVQTPNMISVRGGPPLNEDPAAGLTTGGEVRATDINKIVAKNVREVMDSNLREFLHEELHQKRVRDLQEVTAGLKKLETEETCTKVRGMLNELMELRKRPEFGSYYRNSGRDGNINSFGFELPNEKQMHEMHKKFVQEFASRGSFNPLLEKEARAGLDDLDGNDQHPEGPGMGGGGMMGHMGMGGMSPMGGGRGGRGNAAATAAEIAMVGLSKQPPGRVAAAAARFNEADRAQHDRNLGNFITSGGAGVNRSNAAHAAEGEATSGEMPVIESGGDVEEEEDSEAIMRKKKKKKQKARATNDRRRTSGKERSSSSISRTSEKSRRSSMKKKIGFAAAGGREDHAKATMSGSGGNYNYHRMSKQGAGKHKGGEGESLPSAQRASTAHTPSRAKASSDTKNPLLRKSVGRRMVRHGEGESMPSADSHSFLDSLKEHDQHGKSSGGKKSGGGGGGKPVHHLHPDHHVDDHKDLRSHDAKMEDGEKHKSSKQHHTESVTEETHQKKSHPSRKVIQGEGSGLFDDSRSSNRRSPRSGSSSRRNDRGGSSSRRDDRGGSSSRRDDRGGSSSRRNDRGGHSSRRDDRGGSSSRRDDRGGHASRRDDRGRHSSSRGGSSNRRDDRGGHSSRRGGDRGGHSSGRKDDRGGRSTKHDGLGGRSTKHDDRGGSSSRRQDQGKKEKGGKLKIRVAEVDERGKVIKVTGGTLEDLTREEQKLAQKAYRKAPLGEDTIFMTSKRIKGGRDVHGREGRSSHRGGRGRGEGSAHHHDHSGMTEMRSSVMEPLGRVLGVNIEAGEGEAAEPVVEEEDADASSKSPESSLARTSSAAASPEIESPESQSISITVTEGGTMTATSPSASPSPGDDNPSQQLQQSGKIMQVGRIQKAGGGKFHPPVRGEGESVPLRNSKHAGGEKVISLRDSKPYSEQYQNRGRSKNKMKPEGEASSSSSKKAAKGRKGSSAKKTKRKSEKGKKNGGKKNGGGRSSSRKSSSSSRGSKPKSASRDKKKEKKAKGEGEAAAPPHQQHHYRKSSSSYSSQKGESGSSAAKKEDRLDHLRKKEAQLLQDRDHKDARQQHDPPRKIMKQKGESTSSILNKNKKSKRELVKAEGEAQRSSLGNKSKRVVKAEGEAVSDRGKEESSEIEISSDSEDDPFGEFENEHMDQYGEKIGQVDLDEDNPGRARYKHGGGIVTRAGQTANRGLREGQKGLNDYANQRTEVQQTGYLAANYQGRNAMIETLATAIQTLRQNVSDLTEGMPFVATGLIDVTRPWLSQRLHFAASHDAHLLNTAVDQMQLQMLYDESCAERCGMVHMLEKLGATAADSKRLMYERNLLGGKNVNHVIRNVCNTLRDTLITAIVQCMRNFASVDSRDMTMEDQEGVAEHIQREVDSLVADFGLIGNLRDAIYEKYLGTEVAQWMQTFLQSESAFASVKRNDVGALLQAFGIDLHFRNVVVTIAFTTANYLYRQFSTQQVQLNQKGGMAAEEILKCGRFDFTEIELAVLSPEQREEYENNRRKKRDKRTALQRLEDQEREEEKHVTNLNLDLRVVNSFLIQEYSIYRSANDPESTYAMQDSQGTGFLVDVPVFSDVQIARGSKNLAALVRQRIQVLTKRAAGLSKIMGATDRGTLLYEDRPEVQELEYWRSKMVEIQSYARMATDINNIGKQIKDFHPELDKKAMRQGNDVKFLEKSKAHFDLQLRLQFIRQAIGLKLRLYQTALSHFQHRSMADSAAVDYKGDPTVKHFTLK